MGVRGGAGGIAPLDFEIWHFPITFLTKKVFLVSRSENEISQLMPLLKKSLWLPLKKSASAPLEKSFRRPPPKRSKILMCKNEQKPEPCYDEKRTPKPELRSWKPRAPELEPEPCSWKEKFRSRSCDIFTTASQPCFKNLCRSTTVWQTNHSNRLTDVLY